MEKIGQRISPPNKQKVQLQICMRGDDQATFVFMHPDQDQQKKHQELVKETLQQALFNYRQIVNQVSDLARNTSHSEF